MRVLSSELGPIKIPFTLAIFYNEVTILQYYIVLIVPQVISIVLLLLSILAQDVQLAMLLFGLYALHLLSSAGDIYSFIDLLRRRIPLKAKIKCEYEESKIKGERIYY
ncbi:MAG: metalloprotease family protein [Candidatus Asgardarchaeum sp.]